MNVFKAENAAEQVILRPRGKSPSPPWWEDLMEMSVILLVADHFSEGESDTIEILGGSGTTVDDLLLRTRNLIDSTSLPHNQLNASAIKHF